MNESVNWFTVLLNKWFGGAALALLSALHITPSDPAYPIPNHVAMAIVVVLLAMVFFLWLRPRISVDNPGATQQVMEPDHHESDEKWASPIFYTRTSVMIRCTTFRWWDLSQFSFFFRRRDQRGLPAFDSPTGAVSVPLACALITFGIL